MPIMDWIKDLVGQEDVGYSWNYDDEGVNFILTSKQLKALKEGEAGQLLMHQRVALQMLVEQGSAEQLPNGVLVPSDSIVLLDESSRLLLELPDQWSGQLKTDIQGRTGSTSFKVLLTASDDSGRFTHGFTVEGPIIKFSSMQQYLLTPPQHLIFAAHRAQTFSKKSEYDNLQLLLALKKAQGMGAKISLTHFEKLNIRAPESISVEAELDDEGRLILTPNMGQEASHERMQKVLGQLHSEAATSLRIDDEIILFDEQKLKAVREILKNRTVPKSKVQKFLKNPTAFIDASLVNLDIGFSARVKGATHFRHAYFGETDESEIDWFGKKFAASEVYPASKLTNVVIDKDKLDAFKEIFEKAVTTGADEVEFEGKIYDISDKQSVKEILSGLEHSFAGGGSGFNENLVGAEWPEDRVDKVEDLGPVVVDIELNDDDLVSPSLSLGKAISEILLPEASLDWSNYARQPYHHQELGVRWILGLALNSQVIGGGLLADDMGLGKTFMSLAAMDHLYKH
ncbi:helicase, partial [bacterium]|nr:helicase [bacterium]